MLYICNISITTVLRADGLFSGISADYAYRDSISSDDSSSRRSSSIHVDEDPPGDQTLEDVFSDQECSLLMISTQDANISCRSAPPSPQYDLGEKSNESKIRKKARRALSFQEAFRKGTRKLSKSSNRSEEDSDEDCNRGMSTDLNEKLIKYHESDSGAKGPGIFKRMITRGRSFNEKIKPIRYEEMSNSKESFVKRMSFRSLFNKKEKPVNANTRTRSEFDGPPLAIFQSDGDIDSIITPPCSPIAHQRMQRRYTSADISDHRRSSSDSENCSKSKELDSVLLRSLSIPSSDCIQSTPVPPKSPKPQTPVFRKQRRLSQRSFADIDFSSFVTLEEPTIIQTPSSIPVVSSNSATSLSSMGLPVSSLVNPVNCHTDPVSTQELNKMTNLARGEMTSSNSNDSGIQHDSSLHSSSESLRVSEIFNNISSAFSGHF